MIKPISHKMRESIQAVTDIRSGLICRPPRSTRMRPLVSGLVDDQILIVINDLLTQITAVFVTIGGASDGSGTRTKTTGNYRG